MANGDPNRRYLVLMSQKDEEHWTRVSGIRATPDGLRQFMADHLHALADHERDLIAFDPKATVTLEDLFRSQTISCELMNTLTAAGLVEIIA